MKVNGVNNVINFYKSNTISPINKKESIVKGDTIELSKVAKRLNDYSIESLDCNNSEKVEKIKEKIENGTYKVSSQELAKSIIDNIKGRII